MMLQKDNSCLMVIDVQARLLPGIHESAKLVAYCDSLVELAQELSIPVFGTEQYPEGVGPTADGLRERVGEGEFTGKTFFSCVDAPQFQDKLKTITQDQVVICGMEAHACVLQSAMSFKAMGKQVFVVADAISARNPKDTEFAIARMREEGIKIITREMVGFEWLRRSDAEGFKLFSKKFLR
ncbi:isochorismatase family protein [Neptunomonas japonica]|uniref:isochorismatase family protein n=1 Tax=Neptunomonas japonica TaxID=417574 RepID=UPI00048C13C8|nr:isochorismatase family protein [Neptunomonas japonica]